MPPRRPAAVELAEDATEGAAEEVVVPAAADSEAADGAGVQRVGPGRPRRFAATEELRRIFDAAFTVVARKSYDDVTVADILAEAGVGTRSFYRHFASKDELLNAMFHRDAERFAASVTRRVDAAPDPWAAVVVWVDEVLALGLGGPRAQRAAVLGSPAAVRSLAREDLRRAYALLAAPLAAALAAGAADGAFGGIRPEADAQLINAAAWETLAQMRYASGRADKDRLRADLLSYHRRALVVSEE